MLHETGRVIGIDADGLWVETEKQSTCAKCSAKSGCGQKLLTEYTSQANLTVIKAFFFNGSDKEHWGVGDNVVLGVDDNALVKAAAVAYLTPLISMVLFALAAEELLTFANDANAVFGAVLGLIFGGLLVKVHSRHARADSCYQAKIISKPLPLINASAID